MKGITPKTGIRGFYELGEEKTDALIPSSFKQITNFVKQASDYSVNLKTKTAMTSTIVQTKIKFLLCEIAQTEDKFILQAENPQYMFQVLYFEDHTQFEQFEQINKTEPYIKILGYRIALRLSSALQPINVTQQNADHIFNEVQAVMRDACTWFFESYICKSDSLNLMYKDKE